MLQKLSLPLAFILLALSLGACTPTCADDNLQGVTLILPEQDALVETLNPTFSWTYNDPNCKPANYRVDLTAMFDANGNWTGETGNSDTSWSPVLPLWPGHEYEWAVAPLDSSHIGLPGEYRLFFTGPPCETTDLKAPLITQPDDGYVINNQMSVGFVWKYPDPCLPQQYQVDISDDPTFTNYIASIGTGKPSIHLAYWEPLPDCSTYFWRVAALLGTTMGPFSDTGWFQINVDNMCPNQAPATIRGSLWQDKCPVAPDASPVPDPLPEGCVVDSYGVDADGIRQQGEPDMLNMTINLGPGDCPMTEPMSAITNIHGEYQVSNLTPGKYCLNVNAASFLDPDGFGHWTIIPGGEEGNTYRQVFLTAGQTLGGQDFAYYFPPSEWTPSASTNCYFGPNPVFGIMDAAMIGTPYPIDGRNQAGDWLRLMLTKYKGCWVHADEGVVSGSLASVRVLFEVPTPAPASINCAAFTDQASCQSHSTCDWKLISPLAALYACVSK